MNERKFDLKAPMVGDNFGELLEALRKSRPPELPKSEAPVSARTRMEAMKPLIRRFGVCHGFRLWVHLNRK